MNTIDQFQVFVDFISNIDKQKAVVVSLQDASVQYQKALSDLAQGKSLQSWKVELEDQENKLNEYKDEVQKTLDAREDELNARAVALDTLEALLVQRKQSVDEQVQATDALAKSLNQKSIDLAKKEADLNVQIDENNQAALNLANRLALIKQAGA